MTFSQRAVRPRPRAPARRARRRPQRALLAIPRRPVAVQRGAQSGVHRLPVRVVAANMHRSQVHLLRVVVLQATRTRQCHCYARGSIAGQCEAREARCTSKISADTTTDRSLSPSTASAITRLVYEPSSTGGRGLRYPSRSLSNLYAAVGGGRI